MYLHYEFLPDLFALLVPSSTHLPDPSLIITQAFFPGPTFASQAVYQNSPLCYWYDSRCRWWALLRMEYQNLSTPLATWAKILTLVLVIMKWPFFTCVSPLSNSSSSPCEGWPDLSTISLLFYCLHFSPPAWRQVWLSSIQLLYFSQWCPNVLSLEVLNFPL